MSDSRVVLQWGPKEIEDLKSQLEEIRNALQNGTDDSIWIPGMSMAQSVDRLVRVVHDLTHAVESAPCEAARPGEMTYECRVDSLCRVCIWRSEVTRVLREDHGMF